MYLYGKPQISLFESTNKILGICTLRKIISIPQTWYFFISDGGGNFSGDTMPNYIGDSNFPMFRLSNDISFIPVSYLQHDKTSQNVNLVTRVCEYSFLTVYMTLT